MKTKTDYVISSFFGGFFAISFFLIVGLFNFYVTFQFALVYFLFSMTAGVLIDILLKRRYADIYNSPDFRFWMIIFLQVNLLFGNFFGLMVGRTVLWMLYTILLATIGARIITLLYLISVVFSLAFFGYWFVIGGISYLRKKLVVSYE